MMHITNQIIIRVNYQLFDKLITAVGPEYIPLIPKSVIQHDPEPIPSRISTSSYFLILLSNLLLGHDIIVFQDISRLQFYIRYSIAHPFYTSIQFVTSKDVSNKILTGCTYMLYIKKL